MKMIFAFLEFFLATLNAVLFIDGFNEDPIWLNTLNLFAAMVCFVYGVRIVFDDINEQR